LYIDGKRDATGNRSPPSSGHRTLTEELREYAEGEEIDVGNALTAAQALEAITRAEGRS
jgi:hypothetical protein